MEYKIKRHDDMNWVLLKEYKGTSRDGSDKISCKTIGYYWTIKHAADRMLEDALRDKCGTGRADAGWLGCVYQDLELMVTKVVNDALAKSPQE